MDCEHRFEKSTGGRGNRAEIRWPFGGQDLILEREIRREVGEWQSVVGEGAKIAFRLWGT